jgi:aryl-alcohol dehydrogenase-like predicted oxidoreductase
VAPRFGVLTDEQRDHAAVHGLEAWLVAHGIRPILGTSTLAQLDSGLDGAAIQLSADRLARLHDA